MTTAPDPLPPDQFRCARCLQVFVKGWSDEEAAAESLEVFGPTAPEEEEALLCDPCFKEFTEWAAANGVLPL